MFTSQKTVPEQRLLLRGSTEPFSAALDTLAGLLAAVRPALLFAGLLDGPCQRIGRATCGFCKAAGAEAHYAPLPAWQH